MTATVSSIVCSRYANSLVDLAVDSNSLEQVSADFAALQSILDESEDLAKLVTSPRISSENQMSVMSEISKKAKFSKLTANFLSVLVQNRRLNALDGIMTAFFKEVERRSGHVSVRVETAIEMPAKQGKELEKKVADALGRSVTVEAVVKPEILGGMILTIGSYMIDDSVRRKLDRLGAVLIGGSNQNNAIQNLKEVV